MDKDAIDTNRERYRKKFEEVLALALANPTSPDYAARSGPFKLGLIIHDGPGIMLYDGSGAPMLTEPLRDPEDAVVILNSLNRGPASGGKVATASRNSARRVRSLDDIATTGAGWITEKELEDIISELRSLQERVQCHCVRAAGPDGEITELCVWHERAAVRLYGKAAENLHRLRLEHANLLSRVVSALDSATRSLASLAEEVKKT